MIQFGDPRLPSRFWSKVQPCPMSGCWLWVGSVGRLGYGSFRLKDGTALAHRHAYLCVVGAIPDGLELDHLCRMRCCVNPAHLEPVTHLDNVRRSPVANGSKTHCPSDHAYDETNTYRDKTGRKCRTCMREHNAARDRRRAA